MFHSKNEFRNYNSWPFNQNASFLSMALLLGESQKSSNTTGSLITASQSVGNFQTLQLKTQVGLWEIKMVSTNAYNLKVVGENSMIVD